MNRLTPTYDYSLFSIPVAFGLAMTPHAWSNYRMNRAGGGHWSNIQPRETLDRLKTHLPADLWAKCSRARAASANGLEIFPLFVAAVLGSKIAGVPSAEINGMALRFLGLRTLYTLLYVNHRTEFGANLRSLVWLASVGLPSWFLYRAGQVVNGLGSV